MQGKIRQQVVEDSKDYGIFSKHSLLVNLETIIID